MPPELTRSALERFADSVFAPYLAEYPEPSLAVAVVHRGRVVLLEGYGKESREPDRAVHPESTLFNVASVSKLFTTTAALQLVADGRLALDMDVRARLGRDIIRGDGPAITLRQLLTHTSGVEGGFMRDVVATPSDLVPLEEYFRRFPVKRGRAPGREIRYSNVGMALVGRLVEVASGMPFERYVEENLLQPLEMHRSTFRQPPPAPLAERVATAGSGPIPDALLLAPAGAMVSTAANMSRFMLAQLGAGDAAATRAVPPRIRQEMQRTQWRVNSAAPGVGFGFFQSDLGGVSGVFHSGARTHFSLLYLVPAEELGVFIVHAMRQGGPHRTLRADFVRGLVERFVAPPPVDAGRTAAQPSLGWPGLSTFVGVYRPSLLASSNIERAAQMGMDAPVRFESDGVLSAKIPGGPRLSLRRVGAEHFRVADGLERDLHVVFARDSSGEVTGFTMSGGTQDPVSFERLAWYERGMLHAGILGGIALLFILTALAAPFGALARRMSARQPPAVAMPTYTRWAERAAVAVGLLTLLTPLSTAAIIMTRRGEDTAAEGLRLALRAGLTGLLLAMLAGLALVPLAALAWRERYWRTGRRVYFAVLAAGVVVAIPLLFHYHLLGYWL